MIGVNDLLSVIEPKIRYGKSHYATSSSIYPVISLAFSGSATQPEFVHPGTTAFKTKAEKQEHKNR